MFGLRKVLADAFGVGAVIAFLALQIAMVPAAAIGFMEWSGWSLGWTIAILLFGAMVIPFYEFLYFGFAIYGAIVYFGG